jgi:hypothetical protein
MYYCLARRNSCHRLLRIIVTAFVLLAFVGPASAQNTKLVPGHLVPSTRRLNSLGLLPPTNHLSLVLGLPLRNQPELDFLLQDLCDPASTRYHQWLTPEQFAASFAPAEDDYQKVLDFAKRNGLQITKTHSNRMMVNVDASIASIEKTFKLRLHSYQHPTENRVFYAPDAEPTVDQDIPVLHVAGLDNFILPHRLGGALKLKSDGTNQIVSYATGSSPGGFFMGGDFRHAYVPGVTNTGTGQYIAIIDVGGPYYTNDVYLYQTSNGLTNVVSNIITTFTAYWTNALTGSSTDDGEEALDIDMAMSMAPGAIILNYEGEAHNVFNQIAVDNLAKQMTLSYGFGIDSIIQQIFQQFVAQGQAMSQASGDGGADDDGGTGLTGAPYSTIVGGVSLTTSGAGGPWSSETTWGGSGGGISGYGIPFWQQGINMTTNLGSISYRNYPDVAMPGDNVYLIWKNGTSTGAVGGTSCASPLWAGFMALVNQQASTLGKPAVGFVNPAIYALGKGLRSTYTNCFHDTTTGNTFNNHNPLRYAAGPGYDLCTGWGSPTGSNTINALAGIGTNDFTFYAGQGVFNLTAGASANASIVVTRMNGLAGTATFSITGLSGGFTATINPASTTNTTWMTVSTLSNLLPGTYTATLTGTLGPLTHSETLTFNIAPPIPGATPVNLASYYNRAGTYIDGRTFSGGLDGGGASFSANLIGSTLCWHALVFNLGPSNALDVVSCAAQIINLPAGHFNSLQVLVTGVQGNQANQSFTVTYTDNSTATFVQSFSDWANPQAYSGEATAVTMPYRNLNSGGSQALNVSVFGHSFLLDQTKTVKSLTLPSNSNLILVSAVLANDDIAAPLASYYNRAGIYTDGTTFTNPPTGGLDGSGAAYSGTLLRGSQTWSNTVFAFGPVNATNVISAANQTISLPAGNYSLLRVLATGIQGNQVSQSFTVTYTDSTTTTFVQSLSDWFTPQNYSGESKAVIMGHRDSSNGSLDNRTFYLYGYSLALNTAKTVQSIRLPNNANVIVTAVSLIPNWPPTFIANPFTLASANAGQLYSASFATNTTDLNGGTLTRAKVSGPAWLNVAANGTISGTPSNSDANTNTFVVSVTDSGGLSNTATLFIYVNGAPSFALNPFSTPGLFAGQSYSASIATNASDPNPGDVLTFAKVSGPAWLNVGGNGNLSGTPFSSDIGNNSFFVSVTDPAGLSDTATLNIVVSAAPPLIASLALNGPNLLLNWSGGVAPYQVQMTTNLSGAPWLNFGSSLSGTSIIIIPTNDSSFYRILGQ